MKNHLILGDIFDLCALIHPLPIFTCLISLKIESSPEMLHELIKYI